MKAAWYERQGAAGDVLVLGEMEDAQPRAGEVRIRVAFSGVNPCDIKIRYAHRTLQELRLFYTAHIERFFMRGMVLPVPEQRDRYVVRDKV